MPHVELTAITKRFGDVAALRDVGLTIEHGSVHALVGENGAGKSTLGKVLSGLVSPDSGRLVVEGRELRHASPRDALLAGITIITQELSLVPEMSVVDNVFLGLESSRGGVRSARGLARRWDALVAQAGFALDPQRVVATLPLAEQQKVEILRALAREARLIVFDEPTAVLDEEESRRLFAIIGGLRERGTTVVYVSHFLKEVLALADTVTVLRDGRLVQSTPAAGLTPDDLITAMLGRALGEQFPPRPVPAPGAPVVLAAHGISRPPALHDVSVEVRAGEVVGVAGLVGSGRSELLRALFGADRASAGRVEVGGRPLRMRSPRDAIAAGVAMVPESRREQGLVMQRSVRENVTLASLGAVSTLGCVRHRRERTVVREASQAADVRGAGPNASVALLSGGNQQKVLFAKWLLRRPRVLLADEPTRGVDVGAKRAIYDLIAELAAAGTGVLLVSSEIDELLALSNRVLVLHGGRPSAELSGAQISEQSIVTAAFGPAGGADRRTSQ